MCCSNVCECAQTRTRIHVYMECAQFIKSNLVLHFDQIGPRLSHICKQCVHNECFCTCKFTYLYVYLIKANMDDNIITITISFKFSMPNTYPVSTCSSPYHPTFILLFHVKIVYFPLSVMTSYSGED